MATLNITDSAGKPQGTMEVADSVFAIEPNTYAMHQVVRGKKPWRQKGTGRARQGSIRAAQFRHGGVVFGPHPRSYAFRVPSKVVKLAMRSAVSGKLADSELFVVDNFDFEKPCTKQAVAFLKALDITGRVTVVVNDEEVNAFLSFRNIKKANVIAASEINTYDLVDNAALVMTKDAVKYVEEVLS